MADLITSADIDAFMASANDAAARTELGLTALATTTPGTGIATALAINVGSVGAPILFNGVGGTPTSLVGTNITGTAAGLTAGAASAIAVGGITGLGTNVATALAVNVGSAGAFLTFNGAGGTPSSMVGTNITGTAAGLTAGAVTNGVTAAAAAAGAGLLWTSGGADKSAVATDTITTINATNANVTNLLPVADDGAAVGASGTAFSDLFLASGGVINFNAGNYTLTHSAGVLTANLDLRVTTAGTNTASVVTVGGVQTLTNKSIPVTVEVTAANYTVGTTSALELYGGVIFVTSAATITFPAVVAGQSFTIITVGAIAVSADPNASDLIILDGTTLSDGDKITNLSTAGDIAVITAYDATGWYASTNGWTDTN